jgi:outer membrane protein OmpU
MKKILIATTALVATAGIASAEVAVSGAAKMGLQYNSEGATKTQVLSSATLVVDMSGETDGGLTFGANMNIIIADNGSVANDDTTVYISGAFGKLSMGAVAEADEVAGLGDIGWDGLDVDDVAEAFVGDELGDFLGVSLGHNVNYTISTGALTFSVSGQLPTGHGADTIDSYAIGAKYTFGDMYVGLGYADHTVTQTGSGSANNMYDLFGGDGTDVFKTDAAVTSVFAGGTFGAIKVAAMYSDLNVKVKETDYQNSPAWDDSYDFDGKAYGVNVAYKMDALTLSMGAAQAKILGYKQTSFGVGAAYDLGGGATLKGGIARIKDDSHGSVIQDENSYSNKETRADFGISFSF